MRDNDNAKCQCVWLPFSVHELEMPEETRVNLAILIDAQEFVARCLVCEQYWGFCFSGRHDIPTYTKLSSAEARARVKAWDKAKPERDAWAAQYSKEQRVRATEAEEETEHWRQAEARLASPLSRAIRITAMLCFAMGVLIVFPMMIQGGEPPLQLLIAGSAAFLAGIALGAWHQLRNR